MVAAELHEPTGRRWLAIAEIGMRCVSLLECFCFMLFAASALLTTVPAQTEDYPTGAVKIISYTRCISAMA